MIAFDVEECPLFKNVHTYSFFKILLGCKTREVCLKIEEIQEWRGNVVIFWWIGVFFFFFFFFFIEFDRCRKRGEKQIRGEKHGG